MWQKDSNFSILTENKDKALEAIKGLMGQETIKDSGGRHFSWVRTNEFFSAADLERAFSAWRWETDCDDAGNLISIEFQGEKAGDDKIFFDAIAPYVVSGSYIEMQGEDGCLWRWSFKKGKCTEKNAKITWE